MVIIGHQPVHLQFDVLLGFFPCSINICKGKNFQAEDKNDEKGYIQVYTGDGKGKTTAALGLGLRAVGHGLSCNDTVYEGYAHR